MSKGHRKNYKFSKVNALKKEQKKENNATHLCQADT